MYIYAPLIIFALSRPRKKYLIFRSILKTKETNMTFIEFLKIKKKIDITEHDMDELMSEHYDEYTELLMTLKEGCSQDEMA
jgi:hypothetical protein